MDFHKQNTTTTNRRMMVLMRDKTATIPTPTDVFEDGSEEEEEEEDEEAMITERVGFEEKKQRRASGCGVGRRSGVSSGGGARCQAEKCTVNLVEAKRYHRRHKVCEFHAKAPSVLVSGLRQRFCQQCSRFHELSEFDDTKRSCRRRLAGHNERRRKSTSDPQGEASGSSARAKAAAPQCRPADHDKTNRVQMSYPGNTAYKHFGQIR